MRFLFVDEAGCPGALPSRTSDIQPIFCLTGIFVDENCLHSITREFIELKRKFNPDIAKKLTHDLEMILYEIKGADLRADIRRGGHNQKRRAIGMIDHMIRILENYNVKIISRAYVKSSGEQFGGKAVYTSCIQIFCSHFEYYLNEQDDSGLVIADSRRKSQNQNVSFSIFTKKFQRKGDKFPRMKEMPLFGHSPNHACLQIVDWISSAIIFPMVSYVYCTGYVENVHVNLNDKEIKDRFAGRIKSLSYRYKKDDKFTAGITIIDKVLKRSATMLFE